MRTVVSSAWNACTGRERCSAGNCVYDDPPRRCLVAEKAVAAGTFAILCENGAHGCGRRLASAAALARHETTCAHRRVPCPAAGCAEDTVRLAGLLAHLEGAHRAERRVNAGAVDGSGRYSEAASYVLPERPRSGAGWRLRISRFAGSSFVLHMRVDAALNYNLWVQLLGSGVEAGRYRSSIRVARNRRVHETSGGKVHPIDTPAREVMEGKDCFQVTRRQAEQCMEQGPLGSSSPGALNVTFAIKKLAVQDVVT